MLRVGVVGMGGISGVHMPVWQEMNDIQICAVCDIRPEQMHSYENVNHYTNCDEMLDNEELDILDVCLPTYCIKALKRENQDYISATYEYDDFFVNGESSWFVGDTSFDCGCRFQFEKAIIEFKDGKLLAYQEDRQVVELMQTEAGSSGVINLPTTDAYANEIKYFADCVRENIFPEKIKPQEPEEVLDVLKKFD